MGRPLAPFPCAINGSLFLFMIFYFELLSLSIFWIICLMLSIVTKLTLVAVDMLREHF